MKKKIKILGEKSNESITHLKLIKNKVLVSFSKFPSLSPPLPKKSIYFTWLEWKITFQPIVAIYKNIFQNPASSHPQNKPRYPITYPLKAHKHHSQIPKKPESSHPRQSNSTLHPLSRYLTPQPTQIVPYRFRTYKKKKNRHKFYPIRLNARDSARQIAPYVIGEKNNKKRVI